LSFLSVWSGFVYAIALLTVTFLIEGRRSKKKLEVNDEGGSFALHDIQEVQALYEITIKKDVEGQKK
jgi:hypothetical protein